MEEVANDDDFESYVHAHDDVGEALMGQFPRMGELLDPTVVATRIQPRTAAQG